MQRSSNAAEVLKESYEVTIDVEKCTGCGECVDTCPSGVYELKDGKSNPAGMDLCIGCESCVEACEYEAITVERKT